MTKAPTASPRRLVFCTVCAIRLMAITQPEGSVAVDGVSLTVNRVEDRPSGCVIAINLIPHTVQNTSLRGLAVGALVNLEIDLVARYVERMLGMTSRPA